MNQNRNFKKFMLLWTGELLSAIGGGFTSFGVGVYVFQQTGSAAAMALVTLTSFLPSLLLSAPAGILADRYDRRLLMMIGDGCSALGLIYILICMFLGDVALWQILVGMAVSSIFSSLLEPSYKATITDLLSPEEYAKASGLVGLAGSSKYLLSPVLAGFLLAIADVKLLLILDILTFFVTVTATWVVRKGLPSKKTEASIPILQSFREGMHAISDQKGILLLVLLSSGVCLFMGFIQTLAEPMILSFGTTTTLGIGETICASGMLVSSLVLGIRGIKKGYVRILCLSLFIAGIGMIGFGWKENMVVICIFGFLFFAMLPFANTSLDYLVRTNIPDEVQGRAWGLIGVVSQMGYVIAYALAGVLADGVGKAMQTGVGRGCGVVIMAAGMMLAVIAIVIYRVKAVRELEQTECPGKICMEKV